MVSQESDKVWIRYRDIQNAHHHRIKHTVVLRFYIFVERLVIRSTQLLVRWKRISRLFLCGCLCPQSLDMQRHLSQRAPRAPERSAAVDHTRSFDASKSPGCCSQVRDGNTEQHAEDTRSNAVLGFPFVVVRPTVIVGVVVVIRRAGRVQNREHNVEDEKGSNDDSCHPRRAAKRMCDICGTCAGDANCKNAVRRSSTAVGEARFPFAPISV